MKTETETERLHRENLILVGTLRGIVGIGKGYAFDHIALPAVAERMFQAAQNGLDRIYPRP
jgi:hypothetical protein